MHHSAIIAKAIDESPLNRGLRGADWVDDPDSTAFVEGADVVLFDRDSDGIFEAHFLLQSRGRAAIACVNRAFDMMFENHGANVLFGMIPTIRPDAALMARWCGATFIKSLNYRGDDVELYELTRDQWSARKCHS